MVAQVDRTGCVLTGGDELQREKDCPTLRSDGFVDIETDDEFRKRIDIFNVTSAVSIEQEEKVPESKRPRRH